MPGKSERKYRQKSSLATVGNIARLQRLADSDADYVTPIDMLSEPHKDETAFTLSMRAIHALLIGA